MMLMNPVTELIKLLNELNETEAISFSAYKQLMSLARQVQLEVSK